MRIVMVAPFLGDAFGQEKAVSHSCALLRSRGNEVFLVGDHQSGTLPENDGVLWVPGLSSMHSLTPAKQVEQAIGKVKRYVDQIRPDVIHWHDCFDARWFHSLARNYATLLTTHTIAATCPASNRLTAQSKACTQTSGWGCLLHHRYQGCLGSLKTDLHRAHAVHGYLTRRRAIRKHVRLVLAISQYAKRTLVADGWDPERVRVVPNPVLVPTTEPLADAPSPLIVFAARLTPLKGLEDLLTALSRLKERPWTLWICGEGSDRARYEKLAHNLQLGGRVVFHGRTDPQRTSRIIASATVVVAPNRGPEAFGLSVAEAGLLGKAVVASDVPALDEMVEDGRTGWLYPAGNAEALADTLGPILEDPGLAERRGALARERITDRFGGERHLECLLRCYREAIAMTERKAELRTTQSAESLVFCD